MCFIVISCCYDERESTKRQAHPLSRVRGTHTCEYSVKECGHMSQTTSKYGPSDKLSHPQWDHVEGPPTQLILWPFQKEAKTCLHFSVFPIHWFICGHWHNINTVLLILIFYFLSKWVKSYCKAVCGTLIHSAHPASALSPSNAHTRKMLKLSFVPWIANLKLLSIKLRGAMILNVSPLHHHECDQWLWREIDIEPDDTAAHAQEPSGPWNTVLSVAVQI